MAVGAAFGLKLPDQATLAAWGVPGIAMPAPTVEGRATVTDGDTVKIGRHRIRLHGIDAPESQQYCTLGGRQYRSEEHTSELQSLMRISYAVFCLTKQKQQETTPHFCYLTTRK